MAWVVEAAFHALPLALLLGGVGRFFKQPSANILLWACVVFVSSLEPILVHMRLGSSAYVGVFVFAFTLAQLYLFRRYDFVSMFSCRVVYYLYWHVVWGYLRLRWLF